MVLNTGLYGRDISASLDFISLGLGSLVLGLSLRSSYLWQTNLASR